MGSQAYFGRSLFQFLKDLKTHNNRIWFEENKARYEAEVKQPMLRFITDLGPHMRRISLHVAADPRPAGGSMFRIYRDIRFAKDKSPYKTNVGAHFSHLRGGRDAHAPGFYLHLEPGRSFGGGGLWHPDAPALKHIRDRIAAKPREWKALRDRGIDIEGDALTRVPPGYDPEHPFAEDLKFKDYYTGAEFSDQEATAGDFLDRYVAVCREAAPLMKFLCTALGLAW